MAKTKFLNTTAPLQLLLLMNLFVILDTNADMYTWVLKVKCECKQFFLGNLNTIVKTCIYLQWTWHKDTH